MGPLYARSSLRVAAPPPAQPGYPVATPGTPGMTSIKAGKCVARSGLIVLTNTSASCPASKTVAPVQAVLPVCGHSQEVRCGEDLSLVVFRDKCDKTRECGHKCML
jgi:hypothetical protein